MGASLFLPMMERLSGCGVLPGIPVDRQGLVKLAEKRLLVIIDNLELIDEELVIERLVEVAPGVRVCVLVQQVRIRRQRQSVTQHRRADGQLLVYAGKAGLDAATFGLDRVEFDPDLGLGKRAVRSEIDEVALLSVQLIKAALETGMPLTGVALFVVDGGFQPGMDVGGEILWKPQEAVALGDSVLDPLDTEMGEIAQLLLAGSADEVAVPLFGLAGDLGVDEACGAPVLSAAAAEEDPFEIVLVDPIALSGRAAGVENVLHPIEQLLAHEGFVPTGI
nr:hypothetical protein [Nocardia sp. CC227C]